MMNEWLIMNGLILALTLKSTGRCTVLLLKPPGLNCSKCLNFYLSTLLQSWWEKLNMPLRLVLVYFIIGYTVHSLQFSSPGWCSALLFWFYISKCIRHYPIEILNNWYSVPNPSKDSPILLTSPLSFFRFCPTLFNPSLFVALFLWLNLPSCYI